MDSGLLQILVQTGSTGVVIVFLFRLEKRMAERDAQMWALLEWLIKQPRIDADDMPPLKPPS